MGRRVIRTWWWTTPMMAAVLLLEPPTEIIIHPGRMEWLERMVKSHLGVLALRVHQVVKRRKRAERSHQWDLRPPPNNWPLQCLLCPVSQISIRFLITRETSSILRQYLWSLWWVWRCIFFVLGGYPFPEGLASTPLLNGLRPPLEAAPRPPAPTPHGIADGKPWVTFILYFRFLLRASSTQSEKIFQLNLEHLTFQ